MNPTPAPLWRTNRQLLTLLILLSLTLSLSKGFAAFTVVTGTSVTASGSSSGTAPAGVYSTMTNGGYAWYANTGGTIFGSSSTINTSGTNAYGLYANGTGSYISGTNLTVNTVANSTIGVFANNNSAISIIGGTLSTYGTNSHALFVANSSAMTASNLTIQTNGISWSHGAEVYQSSTFVGDDLKISTAGTSSYGLYVHGGAVATVTNVVITTASTTAYGIFVNGTSQFTGAKLMLSTAGNGAFGVDVNNGSSAAITDGMISTLGVLANGINVTNTSQFTGTNLTVSTTGNNANGISVAFNSTATLTGGTVTTAGSTAFGVSANNTGVVIAQGVKVNTSGYYGVGITSYNSGTMTFSDGEVHTTGTGKAHALYTDLNSSLNVNNTVATTTGASSDGMIAMNNAVLTGSNITITTEGDASHGAFVLGNGSINVTAVDIKTTASNASGIYANTGTVIVNTGTFNVGGDLVTLTGSGINTVNLTNITAVNGTNAVTAMSSATSTLTVNDSAIIGDVQAKDTSVTNVNLVGSTLTGKSALTDTAVLNVTVDNSTWNMTDSSVLTNLTMNNGKVSFKHDSDTSFKTLLVKGDLSGGNGDQIDMSTNLGIRKGDLLVVRGADGGSYTLNVTNYGGAPAGPNEVLRVVSTRDGGAAFTLTGNQYRDAGMYRYHFLKDNNQWFLVNGNGSGNQGGGGADDTTKGGYGGDTPTNNGSGDDGQGGNGSNQGTVPGGTNGEGYTKFSGSVNNDPYVPSGTTTPPTPPTPSGNDLSDLAHDILNATGAQVIAQFSGLDNMAAHFNALRGGVNGSGLNGWMIDEAKRDINIWVQSYGSQYNISGQYGGRNFSNMVYGVDVGADKAYQIDKNNLLVVGVFAGYGQTDADFHHQGSDANSESYGGGVYATWLEQSGWYADLTLRGAYIDGSFDSYNEQYQKSSGSYNNMAASAALNLGKRFTFQDAWYAEPSVGAAYVYLTGYDYQTGGASDVAVSVTDANVFRFKFGSAFGRTINFNGKSWLQPYVKVFGIEQCSDGGKVQSSGSEWRPAMDGLAAQLGCGIVWQLNEDNQLHLDYDAEFGQNYDKPFGITAGFRHQF